MATEFITSLRTKQNQYSNDVQIEPLDLSVNKVVRIQNTGVQSIPTYGTNQEVCRKKKNNRTDCHICDKHFNRPSKLRQHINEKHPEVSRAKGQRNGTPVGRPDAQSGVKSPAVLSGLHVNGYEKPPNQIQREGNSNENDSNEPILAHHTNMDINSTKEFTQFLNNDVARRIVEETKGQRNGTPVGRPDAQSGVKSPAVLSGLHVNGYEKPPNQIQREGNSNENDSNEPILAHHTNMDINSTKEFTQFLNNDVARRIVEETKGQRNGTPVGRPDAQSGVKSPAVLSGLHVNGYEKPPNQIQREGNSNENDSNEPILAHHTNLSQDEYDEQMLKDNAHQLLPASKELVDAATDLQTLLDQCLVLSRNSCQQKLLDPSNWHHSKVALNKLMEKCQNLLNDPTIKAATVISATTTENRKEIPYNNRQQHHQICHPSKNRSVHEGNKTKSQEESLLSENDKEERQSVGTDESFVGEVRAFSPQLSPENLLQCDFQIQEDNSLQMSVNSKPNVQSSNRAPRTINSPFFTKNVNEQFQCRDQAEYNEIQPFLIVNENVEDSDSLNPSCSPLHQNDSTDFFYGNQELYFQIMKEKENKQLDHDNGVKSYRNGDDNRDVIVSVLHQDEDNNDTGVIVDPVTLYFPNCYILEDGQRFKCRGCNKTYPLKGAIKKHLMNTCCVKDNKVKCEKCLGYYSVERIDDHKCGGYKVPSIFRRTPPHFCVCQDQVMSLFHSCKPLDKIFNKLGVTVYRKVRSRGVLKNQLTDMELCKIFEFAHEMMESNKILLIRLGCALTLAYKCLFRTSKGNIDGQKTQSVWTLQKKHLSVEGNNLLIQCLYQAADYKKTLLLNATEAKAFQIVLNSAETYLFAGVKVLTICYLATKWNISLAAARKSAINAFFWKLLDTTNPKQSSRERIKNALLQLAHITNHTFLNAPNCDVNIQHYLDPYIQKLAETYLKTSVRPPYKTDFVLPSLEYA